jgi:hypothetical protein
VDTIVAARRSRVRSGVSVEAIRRPYSVPPAPGHRGRGQPLACAQAATRRIITPPGKTEVASATQPGKTPIQNMLNGCRRADPPVSFPLSKDPSPDEVPLKTPQAR